MKTLTSKMCAILACFMILLLAGCVKNEFKIKFEFPKDYVGNYLVTYYAWDSHKGMWIEQTASLQDGMAMIDGITRLPTIVYISDASSSSNSIAIYVERGDEIMISGDNKNMATWTVKGNKLSERWCKLRNSVSGKKDGKTLEKNIEDYVKKNSSDPLSAILLLTEWNRRENPDGFLKLWNIIDKDVRAPHLIEMCGASDLLGVAFTTKADGSLKREKDSNLQSIIVKSRDNGVDTLKFNKVKASLLYLYTDNNSARKETADSIRKLTRHYTDSAKRLIVDISVDTDSMAWVNTIRRDSIKGAVRAWEPRGIAEANMVKLGVTRLPWFIVKDKKGKEIYAGDGLKDALSSFREEMNKKDTQGEDKKENITPKKK